MKWRRDTCLLRSPPSLTLNLDEAAEPPVLALGVAKGSADAADSFWSNICPRKNKSPLSLTTGRASLVSNRALLNRRRITDPRVARPFRSYTPSFRSRSRLSNRRIQLGRSFFSLLSQQQHSGTRRGYRRGWHFIIASSQGFLSKILSSFLPPLFLPPSLFRPPSSPSRVRLSVEDKRD